jgi:UDP-N-acetyl-D-glucosamine dehydrogenase
MTIDLDKSGKFEHGLQIAVIGQGYVGLSLAMSAISADVRVIGIDTSDQLVERINGGISHIEGVPDKLLGSALRNHKYFATSDVSKVAACEIVIIAVPTPIHSNHKPDLTMLEQACDSIAPHLNSNTLVVSESTSYIGTLRKVVAKRILNLTSHSIEFAVSPERVDPGNLLFQVRNTPRIVGGLTPSSTQRAVNFYSKFCENVVAVSSAEVAEAAKLLENTYRYINIGFINEFSQVMNSMSIPAIEVIDAAATKPFGFSRFVPSAGVGGHCIAVDPFYLQANANELGQPLKFIELSRKFNDQMSGYLVSQLETKYGQIKGKSVLVVGLSYKPNVSDTRESASWKVIDELQVRGAKVSWHDPVVQTHDDSISTPLSDAFDLSLVLVNHDNLDFSDWGDAPIYCINKSKSKPSWIPLIGT